MADVRLRVGADSSEARNQIQTLERQVNGMIRRAEALGATQLISREQQQALESVGRGAQFAGLAIGGLGALAVKGAAQLESLELGLETVFGSAEAATRIFQELTTAAARTPFEIPDLARGASNLKAFGIAAGDVIPRLLQLGDLSRGQTSEFTRLINAYGQAAANQRLLREELNRFIEAGVPILATLKGVVEAQRGTTLSQIEFNKAISDGELDIGHLNVALDQLTDAGGQFAGALDRASQTLEGRFSTVVDEFRFAGAELAEGLLPVVHDVTSGLIGLAQALQGLSPDQIRGITLAAGGLAGLVAAGTGIAAVARTIATIGTAAAAAGPLIAALGGAAVVGPIAAVVLALGGVAIAIKRIHDEQQAFLAAGSVDVATGVADLEGQLREALRLFEAQTEAARLTRDPNRRRQIEGDAERTRLKIDEISGALNTARTAAGDFWAEASDDQGAPG